MVNRNIYDEIVKKMEKISMNHSGEVLTKGISKIEEIKDNFDIKLMFVGHFNAGKSSLLNALIEKPMFLKEAQEPQTAIATELSYNEEESAFAYNIDGAKEIINQNKEYALNQYDHLEYQLNVPVLKELQDFTIVDTPGFDAGIEVHTKALLNYIGKGSAYIVVIDQEKGGLDKTTIEFIKEISHYSNQVSILINKCDKITPEVAEDIAESVRFTLSTYGFTYKVYTISKKDLDVSSKLLSIILGFNAQMAFEQVLTRQIKTELINMEKILSITKQKIYLDTFDLDTDIATYTRLEERLTRIFENKKTEAEDRLDNTVQEVTNHIRGELICCADSVAEALLNENQTAAEAIIVETIRPVLLDAMKDISIRQIDDVTTALDFSGLINDSEAIDLKNAVVNLAINLKNFIDQGVFENESTVNTKGLEKKKIFYHAITGFTAITTNVIGPWIEVVIILLPEIISILHSVFGESDTEVAKRRFVNYIIPQIINKIYPLVRQNVENTTKLVLDEYENIINENIKSIKQNIIDAQNMKRQKTESFENYESTISNDIETVKMLLNEMGGKIDGNGL